MSILVEPNIEPSRRELLTFQAQICEESERFDDMVKVVGDICKTYDNLTLEERDLLSCAYKNVIGCRQSTIKILHNQLLNENLEMQQKNVIVSYLTEITNEYRNYCNNILKILNERLIPSAQTLSESWIFYHKMKGDYLRYLCEVCVGGERKERANESLLSYKHATEKAVIELSPTHPVRLGLMLNFSVFYYEIMKSPERSCRLAKEAFEDALAELDTLSEERYRESTLIMQLLRDNLLLWESDLTVS